MAFSPLFSQPVHLVFHFRVEVSKSHGMEVPGYLPESIPEGWRFIHADSAKHLTIGIECTNAQNTMTVEQFAEKCWEIYDNLDRRDHEPNRFYFLGPLYLQDTTGIELPESFAWILESPNIPVQPLDQLKGLVAPRKSTSVRKFIELAGDIECKVMAKSKAFWEDFDKKK